MHKNKKNFQTFSMIKNMYEKQVTNILHGAILNAFAPKSKQSKITTPKFKMTITTFI